MSNVITFFFDGKELLANQGESIAAALISNDERITRVTRIHAQPRGVFCGIGICFDCLVVVDGINNQRACLIQVNQGMQVETQHGVGEYLREGHP